MKRTEITVETNEIWIIRPSTRPLPGWCTDCEGIVNRLWPEDAASLVDVRVRVIYQWVEAGKVHYLDSPEGHLLICVCSLMRQACQPV
jgi:hypothetical protein